MLASENFCKIDIPDDDLKKNKIKDAEKDSDNSLSDDSSIDINLNDNTELVVNDTFLDTNDGDITIISTSKGFLEVDFSVINNRVKTNINDLDFDYNRIIREFKDMPDKIQNEFIPDITYNDIGNTKRIKNNKLINQHKKIQSKLIKNKIFKNVN